MFRKSTSDLIKGYRNARGSAAEAQYVSKCVGEIREEVKSPEQHIKAEGLQKLTYLNLVAGVDMGWASFAVVEVMSFPRYAHKRIGYAAATQSFNEDTEVLMLLPNLLRKDLGSSSQFESGLAITCLANICTPDLARDVVSDVAAMLNSSKPYVRKKAVLLMYRIFLKFPEALRPSFPRLREKLEDSDPSVVSAAVNVMCELARKNPKNYLSLAPVMFRILTTSSNNWMLIRVLKFLQSLVPHEPRLSKKLVEPLTNLVSSTPAKSLLYECIETAIIGCSGHMPLVRLCLEKLKLFVEDPDPNLKYLGLLGLKRVMSAHPKTVSEYKDLVLQCLDDEDVTIRRRALDLISGMVSKRNVADVVAKVMSHIPAAEGSYRGDLVEKCISICSKDDYAVVPSFQWYIGVLVELARVKGTSHGGLIASQLLDVIVRVKAIRKYGVAAMAVLLQDKAVVGAGTSDSSSEALYAAAWVVGEYPGEIPSPDVVVEALLQPRATSLPAHIQAVYMQNALKVWVHCAGKATGAAAPDALKKIKMRPAASDATASDAAAAGENSKDAIVSNPAKDTPVTTTDLLGDFDPMASSSDAKSTKDEGAESKAAAPFSAPTASGTGNADPECVRVHSAVSEIIASRLPLFSQSVHVEVQERAMLLSQTIALYTDLLENGGPDVAKELNAIFADELHPVAPKAQRKVPVPKGLDLDKVINDVPEDDFSDENDDGSDFEYGEGNENLVSSFRFGEDLARTRSGSSSRHARKHTPTAEELERIARDKEMREKARMEDPFYLGSGSGAGSNGAGISGNDVDDIPIVKLSSEELGNLQVGMPSSSGMEASSSSRRHRHGRRGRHKDKYVEDEPAVVSTTFAMPEGAISSDEDEKDKKGATSALDDIDLSKPLGVDEQLPQATVYEQQHMHKSSSSNAANAAAAGADDVAADDDSRPAELKSSSRRSHKHGKHGKHHHHHKSGSDRKHRHGKSGRSGGKSSGAADPAGSSIAAPAGDSLIDFDPISSPSTASPSLSGTNQAVSVSQIVGHDVSFDRINSPSTSMIAPEQQSDVLDIGSSAPSPITTTAAADNTVESKTAQESGKGHRHRHHHHSSKGDRKSKHRSHRSKSGGPPSSRVHPVKASYDELQKIMSSGSSRPFHSVSLTFAGMPLDVVVNFATKGLNVALVEKVQGGAALYGRTGRSSSPSRSDDHVCVLVRAVEGEGSSSIVLEIKSTDGELAKGLGVEMNSAISK